MNPPEKTLAPATPPFPGWLLLGAFPDHEPNDVGSWLLHHGGHAMLLEVPPGLAVPHVAAGLQRVGAALRFVTASHAHEDHLDPDAWNALIDAFPDAEFVCPSDVRGDRRVDVGGEPAWLVKAPKHSRHDVVTVFRGVAMTGDIELGTLDSVNREVHRAVKAVSMDHLRGFPARAGYHVHATVSAHLNDVRHPADWHTLFSY